MKIEKLCPKCGYDDMVLTYTEIGKEKHGGYKELFSDFGKLVQKSPNYSQSTTLVIDKECIRVHCKTCQYSFVTDTISSETQEETAVDINDIEIPTGGFFGLGGDLFTEGGHHASPMVDGFLFGQTQTKDKTFEDMFEDIFASGIFAKDKK